MADYNSGNFINPDYATPEQVAQMRLYAEQLLKPKSPDEISPSWAGALAAGLQGAFGGAAMGKANQLQRQLLQQGQQGIQQAGQTNPYAAQLFGAANPTQPPASNGAGAGALPFAGNPLHAAILQQESGNNPNIGNSSAGAVGPGQIMPQTFASAARPGENINNPDDNRNVSGRLMDGYMAKFGDPARAAVAYYSGPGNVAPPGSPTPWIKDIQQDRNGNPIKPVSSYVNDIMGKLGGRQTPPTQQTAQNGGDLSAFYMNPSIPKELKDAVQKGNTPVGVEDAQGRQGYTTPMGGPHLVPQGPGFVQGYRGNVTVGADGQIAAPTVFPAPGSGGGVPSMRGQIDNLYQTGQDLARQSSVNKATRESAAQDFSSAALVPQTRQILATMKDDIMSHGDKMTFGPTADWVNNLKRGIAQHAPGLMSESDIQGLASADSFDKLSAQLQSIVGRQVGGTDASLMQGMRSVPGQHNSKEGALALIDMLDQVSQQQAKFAIQNVNKIGQPGFNYIDEKNKFFEANPIVNPITKHPLRMDLSSKGNIPGANLKSLSDDEIRKRLGL